MTELERQISDADAAEYILSHPVFVKAFAGVESEIQEMLADVNMHDTAGQKELLRSLKNLRRVKLAIQTTMHNGIIAKDMLKRSKLKELIGL